MMSMRAVPPAPLHFSRPRFNQPLPTTSFERSSTTCCCSTPRAPGPWCIGSTTVRQPRIEADKVVVQVQDPDGASHEVQARLLVDASGRTALLGSSWGQR